MQNVHQLCVARRRLRSAGAFWIAVAETTAGIAIWTAVAVLVGFVPFLFVFVLPLLVANTIVMAFILTNHNLSPRVAIDDPLVSELSARRGRRGTSRCPWPRRFASSTAPHASTRTL